MTRFMRVIHVFAACALKKDVDGPDEPGHESLFGCSYPSTSSSSVSTVRMRRARSAGVERR